MLSLFYFAKAISKQNKELILMFVFEFISNALEFYFCLPLESSVWHFLLNLAFQMFFLFYFYKLFQTYKKKFLFFKFSHGDYLLFACFSLIFSLGVFSYTYGVQFVEIFILSILLLIFVRVLPTEKFMIFSCLLAVGSSAIGTNYYYLIFAIVSALFLVEFKEFNKWIFACLSLLMFFCLIFIFKMLSVAVAISICVSVLVAVVIPDKWLNYFSKFFDMDASALIFKFLEERKILEIKSKLLLMSNTFLSMHKDFKFLIVGKLDRNKASEELSHDIISKCCSNCENFKSCFFENINKKALFEELMSKAISCKKISEDDMTNGLQAYCSKSGIVVSEINQTAKLFQKFEVAMKNEDTSKLLISDELKNFSDIFSNFAGLINSNLKTNERLSKTLKEQLVNNLIDAKEVVILENKTGIESVNVIASNEQVLKKEMPQIISKITKNFMRLKVVEHTEISGLSLASFVPISKLRVEFFVSTKAKEKRNGDNVIVSKLSENRYFVAIADGMGHGESANRISSMVLSLIRSMFEVGLDINLIIQSVNKLLLPAGLDNFTTLDACVVDLDSCVASFIKLGSSVSAIKHKLKTEIVACESLPIGIVQNITPTISSKSVQSGDVIFLASDGIVDSFSNIENFRCFVNDAKIFNMQKFLDDVVVDAGETSKHADDMTIIAINLLKNY